MKNESRHLEEPIVESNEKTSDVLATWGHEVRNPLSALGYALEIWQDAICDPCQMEELRAIIERQVRQLKMLSADLLDVAQITHGKRVSPVEPVDLKNVIADACEEVQPLIRRCGHTLSIEQCREPTIVNGDSSRLLQVFANLLQNAAKYTDPGGKLAITIASHNAMAEVRIQDNGRGIDPHFLTRIFEKFTQVPGCQNDGVGFGLGLVQAIVQWHGGTVSVHSEGLGYGSEFTVRLPLREEPIDASGESPTESTIGPTTAPTTKAKLRILVVDDNPSLNFLLARLLGNLGHSVEAAEDGETAIRMVLYHRPQVVFLDLMMPGIDGYEVARRLRQHPERKDLFLIALSGSGGNTSRQRALKAGFDQYLMKPADISEIAAALAKIAEQPSISDAM